MRKRRSDLGSKTVGSTEGVGCQPSPLTVSRMTTFVVGNLKTARQYEGLGHSYTWEMDGDRPTGRCIVRLNSSATP